MSQILDDLRWRYATKQFDPARKLSSAQIETLEESLRLTASSFGLQPWKFLFIEDADLRAPLVEHSWGQPQVVDASHLVVFCAPASFGEPEVDRFLESVVEQRGVPLGSLDDYAGMMKGFLAKMSDDDIAAWIRDQIYLALGAFLTVCAVERIDACPMEGFNPAAYDEALGLAEKGLRSVVLCPVGYRLESDKYAELAKVRYSRDEVIEEA